MELEYVYKIKIIGYNSSMRFEVVLTRQARKEFEALTPEQRISVGSDYETIRDKGIEFVKRRFLQNDLFEIKTNDVRSLFEYEKDRIIIVGLVYVKKSQKAPQRFVGIAKKRIKEHREE